ncbi:uncharacterized protein MONBRDRAFT_21906 [Monosiga brevicollis MX1]|uniref:Transcription initiation factor TFIID subunit 10 n=1 Tax=Monosiga brevicollis TaxID=81824 RepID=A9UNY9_MONBE|nr:uncharacterized protein MONBRDRAFT_21906 [Monosiga brevicollis MX1]EDQ92327.1 predicted protein [Monosiga brevicollis MX1]|eukprot:XP_001742089.1 hypothetical protein [Monosiga brevicollis MX1]
MASGVSLNPGAYITGANQAAAATAAQSAAAVPSTSGDGQSASKSGGAGAAGGSKSESTPVPKRTKVAAPVLVTGDQLAAFSEALDDFVPVIPDEVIQYYLRKAGVDPSDQRVVRMVSLATQKFVADTALDAMNHNRHRAPSKKGKLLMAVLNWLVQEDNRIMGMDDLSFALKAQGVDIAKPAYYT